ncbi:H(+)/Cl(-) exchange transporter ClcA [Gloeothece verrucosa]|uniref:Cl-channel voltage-gated family protein n=1 Tax=Gloeothece verrucosa (strain PCC 7822) TaxID=497965 RepID=E0UHT5_GLOV7|nr:H(+)/Cl(-) exchange transporter ClcA [Gloeothece verrucosa]ADN13342.1 Cl- channel voltage-gated family protein [Gloeothece verrucosa PCC 7822]
MNPNPDPHSPETSNLSEPVLITQRFIEATQKLNLILLYALLVGIVTGFIGTYFRLAVEQILHSRSHLATVLENNPILNYGVSIILSGIMGYIAFWLMRQFAPDTGGSGIPQIEGFLDGVFPIRWQRVLPVKILGGLLTLGSGMILGREGPTIQIGGSAGKMVGSYFRVSVEEMRILVAAGAGAGLTTAFNAPLAGIVFVLEEMRPEFKHPISSTRSIALACVSATITTRLINGQQAVMSITHFDIPPLDSLWIFAILGLFIGVIGYLFNFFLVRTLNWFASLKGLAYQLTGLSVGAIIGLASVIYRPITGGGDDTIYWAFDVESPGYVLILVFLLRFVLTMVSYGSGAPGGIFAPMLALATIFSLGAAREFHGWFPQLLPEPAVLAIAGMGALVAATVRAPLTAIILTIEMTDNYLLILPLLITCLVAAMTAHGLGGEPIYSVLLKRMLAHTHAKSD